MEKKASKGSCPVVMIDHKMKHYRNCYGANDGHTVHWDGDGNEYSDGKDLFPSITAAYEELRRLGYHKE